MLIALVISNKQDKKQTPPGTCIFMITSTHKAFNAILLWTRKAPQILLLVSLNCSYTKQVVHQLLLHRCMTEMRPHVTQTEPQRAAVDRSWVCVMTYKGWAAFPRRALEQHRCIRNKQQNLREKAIVVVFLHAPYLCIDRTSSSPSDYRSVSPQTACDLSERARFCRGLSIYGQMPGDKSQSQPDHRSCLLFSHAPSRMHRRKNERASVQTESARQQTQTADAPPRSRAFLCFSDFKLIKDGHYSW